MPTTLMPVDPAMSPQRVTRLLGISANLLPEEIVTARQARRTRTWVLLVVVLVAALCAGWAVLANREKAAADDELTAATTEVIRLQRDQREYASVVKVRNDTDQLRAQLKTLMANDLDWAALLTLLRTTGEPSDVVVDGVTGDLAKDGENGEGSSGTLPSTSESGSIGSITVTGKAPDKEAVAAYVDRLAKQATLANPYVTSVTSTDDEVTFSLSVDITQAALCGRFGEPCKSTGGK